MSERRRKELAGLLGGSKPVAARTYNRSVMRLPLRYFDLSRDMRNPFHLRLSLASYARQHVRIPPAAHTYQSDVETVHRLIEDEFYEVESFSSRSDFLAKATTSNLWFNTLRKNSYKQHRSPWDILHARDPTLPKQILTFPPLFLDELHNKTLELPASGGYDLYSVSLIYQIYREA